jgi:hypothetical protein
MTGYAPVGRPPEYPADSGDGGVTGCGGGGSIAIRSGTVAI